MRHPFLVEGRPKCARQSLASTLSAPRVAATSCCDPGRHANVITPCLLAPCLNVPYLGRGQRLCLPKAPSLWNPDLVVLHTKSSLAAHSAAPLKAPRFMGALWPFHACFEGGKFLYLQLQLLSLQLSFFAYSWLSCLLEARSHCKQESSILSKKASTESKKARAVSKKQTHLQAKELH